MKPHTKLSQENLTPKAARELLIEGNERFVDNLKIMRNLKNQVIKTSEGQFPFAVIHSCIDSRVPVELVFDLGIGYTFSSRVAGNIINADILGSMEYSCKVAGAKVVVVMGHTKCGAVTAACKHVELGNITHLLAKVQPAVEQISNGNEAMSKKDIEKVSIQNIHNSIDLIRMGSPILKEMEEKGEIEIVGASYDVNSGKVTFFEW